MFTRCGWCKKILKEEDGKNPVGKESTGICKECAEKALKEAK